MLPIVDRDSRLIVLYLALVLLAGGILTYLSINNISNFQELTEKRILEEEKEIHSAYVSNFQNVLNGLTGQLGEQIQNETEWLTESGQPGRHPLVSDYLVIRKNGVLIRPHFSIQVNLPATKSTTGFTNWYERGELQEFQKKDFEAAEAAYSRALEMAGVGCDSAKALNALSRLQNKLTQPEKARILYQTIFGEFGLCPNRFGIPYAYFAVDRLLKEESGGPKSERNSLISEFLQNLVGNKIAFASTTQGLLDTMSEHRDLASDPQISDLILAAREKLIQIQRYRPVLQELLEGDSDGESNRQNDFVMVPPSAEGNDLFAVYKDQRTLFGFVVPFELLDQQARKGLKWDSYDFGYELITTKRTLNPQRKSTLFEFEGTINTNFPNEALLVRPENPGEIHDFVFRRKLITYLGLTLLVAAMIIGLYMLVQDVNRKKKMARLRTDFVANVTHELKTPLTSINMFADSILLNRYHSDEGLKKYARIILKESEKLKRMVNNILEFARQENNRVFYELREENISEIIYQVMEEMNYWLSAHNFKVRVELDEDLYAMVDAEGLKQVLSNLITNAIKYSPEDKAIAIRAYRSLKEICIDVEDHGIGIPEGQLESIFKKFYRVSEEHTAEASGTGLGLTVSKEIIEAMNGTLTVRSTPGKGSIFTITLYTITS